MIVLIIIKATLATSLGSKVVQRTRKSGQFSADLVFAMFLFMVLVAVARVIFSIFDFYLTDFNTDYYVANVWVWKIGMILSQAGIVVLLFVPDKTVFKFKLKGILAYIVAAEIVVQVIYPVNTLAEFNNDSLFTLVEVAGSIILPIMFFMSGSRQKVLRKSSWQIAWGVIFYIIGGVISLTPPFFSSGDIRVYLYVFSTISKCVGLIAIYFGT